MRTRYSVVADIIESYSRSPNDSTRLSALFSASGVLRGVPRSSHPSIHTRLQAVIVSFLHRLPLFSSPAPPSSTPTHHPPRYVDVETGLDLWESAVGFVLAHSGLCSKHTTLDIHQDPIYFISLFILFAFSFHVLLPSLILNRSVDIDNDVPKALEVLVRVLVSDVFGGWIFTIDSHSTSISPSSLSPQHTSLNSGPATSYPPVPELDIHQIPIRAHAHVKTAHFSSSGAFTSSISRLFTVLPPNHPSRDLTVYYLHSHAKLMYLY